MILNKPGMIIPFILIVASLSVIHYNQGFMSKFNQISKISNGQSNPYISEMYFESEDQRLIYTHRWFPQSSKKTVVYLIDCIPYNLAIGKNNQNILRNLNELQFNQTRKFNQVDLKELNELKYPQKSSIKDLNSFKINEMGSSNNNLSKVRQVEEVMIPEAKMKSISDLMNKEFNNTVLLCSLVEGFTVTATRVKAFSTGMIPGVLDIFDQINSSEIEEDHLFRQLKAQNETVLTYGIDIWKNFFKKFIDDGKEVTIGNVEGIIQQSPIYAKEIVDLMKQKAISSKTNNKQLDWSFILFHDSSFDIVLHMGKIYQYPNYFDNPVYNNALSSVDKGSADILAAADEDTTVLVISDHGYTTDKGEHGGNSLNEQQSLFFAYSKKGFILDRNIGQVMNRTNLNGTIDQVDFLATVSMLKGIAIPANSQGVIIPDAFINHPWMSNTVIVNAYYTNLRQLEDYFTESLKSQVGSKKFIDKIKLKIKLVKEMYNSLFDKENNSNQIRKLLNDIDISLFIQQVREVSALMKQYSLEQVTINFFYMKVSSATMISLIIVIAGCLILFGFSLSSKIQQENFKISQLQIVISKVALGLGFIVGVFLYIFEVETLVGVLNLFAILISIMLLIQIIILLVKNFKLSYFENHKFFSFRSIIPTLLFLVMCITFPILLTSNNLFYSLDYYCFLIISFVIVVSTFSCNFKKLIFFKSIACILMLLITTYMNSNQRSKVRINNFFEIEDLSFLFSDDFFTFFLPLLAIGSFNYSQVKKIISLLKNNHRVGKALGRIFWVQFSLCSCYFIFKKKFPLSEQLFNIYFCFLSQVLFLIQTIYLAIVPTSMNFIQKYKLFFISLVFTFTYIMGSVTIAQIPVFFFVIFSAQDIFQQKSQNSYLLTFTLINILSFFFYTASGHGFNIQTIQTNTSQIGVVLHTQIQVIVNVLIANLSWFFLAALSLPLILEKEVDAYFNNSYRISRQFKFKEVQSIEITQISEQPKSDSLNLFENQQINIGLFENNQEDREKYQQANSDSSEKIEFISFSTFKIICTRSIILFNLTHIIGFLGTFFRNIIIGFNSSSDLFTFLVIIQLLILLCQGLVFIILQLLQKFMYLSFKNEWQAKK